MMSLECCSMRRKRCSLARSASTWPRPILAFASEAASAKAARAGATSRWQGRAGGRDQVAVRHPLVVGECLGRNGRMVAELESTMDRGRAVAS